MRGTKEYLNLSTCHHSTKQHNASTNTQLHTLHTLSNTPMVLAFWVISVALLWGCTNPLLNKGAQASHTANTQRNSSKHATESAPSGTTDSPRARARASQRCVFLSQVVGHIVSLFLNWKFVVPFVLNQLGSVAYAAAISSADISLVLPLCNALTLVVTAITARLLGERSLNKSMLQVQHTCSLTTMSSCGSES
jgi:drug/metabolite transporter (DMT)-like permease